MDKALKDRIIALKWDFDDVKLYLGDERSRKWAVEHNNTINDVLEVIEKYEKR